MRRGFPPTGLVRWPIALAIFIFSLPQIYAQQPGDPQQLQPQSQTLQSAPQRTSVHGTVINSATREPIARALVSLEGDASTAMLTDGEGHFEFQNMTVGPHVFSVRKPGYSEGDTDFEAVDTTMNLHQMGEVERNVIVSPEMGELSFALTQDAAIRGHIELSTGDPADNIMVQLIRKNVVNGRTQWSDVTATKTNSSGNYRFPGLMAGIYSLHTLPAKDAQTIEVQSNTANNLHFPVNGFPATYYADAHDFSSSTPIQLKAGEETQANLNLTLETFQPVVVKVLHATDGEENGAQQKSNGTELVALTDENGNPLTYPTDYNKSKREITANLPDGNYILTIAGVEGQPNYQDLTSHIRAGSTSFAVEGHPVENLRLATGPMQPLVVHLHLPDSLLRASGIGQNGAPPVFVSFTHASGPAGDMTPNGPANQETMTFIPGNAGRYWASTTAERTGSCVGSFVAGGADLAREPLVLNPSSSTPALELTLRDDCAKLKVNLPYLLSLVMPGVERSYTVYVVPDFDSTATVTPMTLRASSGGTATLESLTPGSYHVYTFTSPVAFEYHNPAVLQQFTGQAITLGPSSTMDILLEVPEK